MRTHEQTFTPTLRISCMYACMYIFMYICIYMYIIHIYIFRYTNVHYICPWLSGNAGNNRAGEDRVGETSAPMLSSLFELFWLSVDEAFKTQCWRFCQGFLNRVFAPKEVTAPNALQNGEARLSPLSFRAFAANDMVAKTPMMTPLCVFFSSQRP